MFIVRYCYNLHTHFLVYKSSVNADVSACKCFKIWDFHIILFLSKYVSRTFLFCYDVLIFLRAFNLQFLLHKNRAHHFHLLQPFLRSDHPAKRVFKRTLVRWKRITVTFLTQIDWIEYLHVQALFLWTRISSSSEDQA